MTEYERVLQNVEEGTYATEITPQHENHRAWGAVYTIPKS